MFRRKRSSPTPVATLVIIQGSEADEIEVNLEFWPPERRVEDPLAFKAMMVGYTAILTALEGTIEVIS